MLCTNLKDQVLRLKVRTETYHCLYYSPTVKYGIDLTFFTIMLLFNSKTKINSKPIKMKKLKMLKSVGVAAILGLGISSCEVTHKDEVKPVGQEKNMENILVPYGFNWELSKDLKLNLLVKDAQNKALPNAYIKVYDFDPIDTETGVYNETALTKGPVFSGQSDEQGRIDASVIVGTAVSKLYVCPAYPSLPDRIVADVEGSSQLNLTIGGTQVRRKAAAMVMKKSGSKFKMLSECNTLGVPNDLIDPADVLDAAFLASVEASLPERKKVTDHHPNYIAEKTEPNLILKKEAEISLTFVHEGAGFRNAVGYYTYPIGQEPQSVDDIETYIVAFPNASLSYDGKGDLQPGDKMKLRYWDAAKGEFKDKFPANTVVAWFLIADGWRSEEGLRTNKRIVYSNQDLNVEVDPLKRRHNVLLYDYSREHLLLGFEDLHREQRSDEDFNDAVFFTKVTPFDAIDETDLEIVDNPDDEDKEFDNFTSGTLAYEDLWPSKGDYDFNDMVIDYKFNRVTDHTSKVTKLECQYTVRAIGASFHNGFALQLPISHDLIESVEGAKLDKGYLNVAGNGTETGQSMAVIPFFEDAYSILPYVGGSFVNTTPGIQYSIPQKKTVTITFIEPLSLSQLGVPPFNPFMIVNHSDKNRFAEVHLPNKKPSDLANPALFGTKNDRSDVAAGHTYLSDRNLPWALNIPESFEYPIERAEITDAYLNFAAWAESNGTQFKDWYEDKPAYRNSALIYSH